MSTPKAKGRLPSPQVLVRNRCNPALIDGQFMPLIDAVAVYIDALPGIVDIRLQGSVARGEAIVGLSDIDFTALVDDAPDDGALAQLQDQATRLSRRYPVISRVELEVAPLKELAPFQLFALSSDSLSVYGDDTLTQSEHRVDRIELTRLVTPPVEALITDYRALFEDAGGGAGDEEMRFYCRIVGKDLLKCLRALILLGGGEYEVAIDRIHGQVGAYVPELAALADQLHQLYREPVADSGPVIEALDHAAAMLLPAIRGTC
jgi:predicted nucleotidyltransferase